MHLLAIIIPTVLPDGILNETSLITFSVASAGFARNLRKDIFEKVQGFSFPLIFQKLKIALPLQQELILD